MTRYTNNAEGGTNGTTVTTANSGGTSGDAWDLVSIGTGAGLTFTSTNPLQGSRSYQFVNVSGQSNYLRKNFAADSDLLFFRFRVQFDSLYTVATELVSLRNAASATAGTVNMLTTGRLSLVIAGTTVYTSPNNSIVANVPMLVEVGLNKTAGTYTIRAFRLDTSAELFSSSGAATYTNALAQVRVGKTSTSTAAVGILADDFVFDNSKATLEGIPVTAPTASATQDAGWAKLDATGSTAGQGGTLSFSISPTTNTYEPVEGIFLVKGGVTYTITVTEGAQTATTQVVVPVGGSTTTTVVEVGIERVFWNGTDWVGNG